MLGFFLIIEFIFNLLLFFFTKNITKKLNCDPDTVNGIQL